MSLPIRARQMRLAGFAILLPLALAGCTTASPYQPDFAGQDYEKRHPFAMTQVAEVLDVTVGPRAEFLSKDLHRALAAFAEDYRLTATGGLTIQVPEGSANEDAALALMQKVKRSLEVHKIDKDAIATEVYPASELELAPVRVSFLKVRVATPQCGLWPNDVRGGRENRQLHNFGCASRNNLAAMIETSSDLFKSRALEPADGARRALVIRRYQAGGPTGSGLAVAPPTE